MTNLPGPYISSAFAVECLDCKVIFDGGTDKSCPRCASEISFHAVKNGEAASLIKTQRNLIDEAEGVLLTVSKRHHGASSALCARMVERIRESKERAPVSPSAHDTRKEVPVQ